MNATQKRSLFIPRFEIKPYEYPELLEFKDAIRHSYWLHTEFNFTGDIQDFRTHISDVERTVITKTMLAISQIEVSVKRFLESEIRHKDAYSFLLEKLGLNEMFLNVRQYKAIMARIEYMEAFMRRKDVSQQDFVLSLIMFSLFVEHISLFSQFVIMMSFNKHKNLFKGISNAVEATSKEEEIHGRFGITLYGILREEQPELFTDAFFTELKELADQAFMAEKEILNWIFEDGELDFLSKATVENYIANRYNNSLQALGLEPVYNINPEQLKETEWFDIEILSTKETDFFNKRSTDYSKKMKQITAEDLF